jgi:lipid-binding SYLF domain-containing protein
MRYKMMASAFVIALLAVNVAKADSPEEQKAKIRQATQQTLQDLYKLQPSAQGAIQKAAGYAVFKNFGTNVLVVSTASGKGIATNNQTKQETFMKMISGGAGLGIGVKDFRVIFVFGTDKAFNTFLESGWSGSGQADAAAKAGTSGGAVSGAVEVAPDTYVYQITKNGLALQLTLQGTKYYKDDDLNK